MSSIIEKIVGIKNLYHAKGCTLEQIKKAENELQITFPDEYKDIVEKYGAISFFGTEWTGLNVDDYLNVVVVTKQERGLNSAFPTDCFVLENHAIDGILVICNEKGEIFSCHYSNIEKIYDSISSYLDECIRRSL